MLFLYKNAEERRIIKKINESLEAKVQAQVEEIRSKDLMMSQKAKMASMGELLGAIAHQWKQPLSTISLIAQYIEGELEKQPLEKDEGAELTGVLKEQADFMNATINDFLNFLKPGSDPVVFDVSKAISDMTEMFKFLFSINNITINISACGHYGFLTEGYLNEFKHVVFNLLNNSKDAISSRKIRDAELQGKIEIKISSNLTDITIEITDNGGGIPDNIINSVFEQYFSTKGEKGTGIGLYMAKNLIEKLMSGRINVANVKDGACFRIDLKRYSE
jgi:signal transduction histidine kinase